MSNNYIFKEGSVSIFRNERKQDGDKLPHYTGKCMIDGKMKDISLWIKESDKGKFFSGQIKEAYVKPSGNVKDDMLEEKPQSETTEEPFVNKDDESDFPF